MRQTGKYKYRKKIRGVSAVISQLRHTVLFFRGEQSMVTLCSARELLAVMRVSVLTFNTIVTVSCTSMLSPLRNRERHSVNYTDIPNCKYTQKWTKSKPKLLTAVADSSPVFRVLSLWLTHRDVLHTISPKAPWECCLHWPDTIWLQLHLQKTKPGVEQGQAKESQPISRQEPVLQPSTTLDIERAALHLLQALSVHMSTLAHLHMSTLTHSHLLQHQHSIWAWDIRLKMLLTQKFTKSINDFSNKY